MDIRVNDKAPAPSAGSASLKPGSPAPKPDRPADLLAQPAMAKGAAPAATTKEELTGALASINDVLKDRAPGLEFSFDKDDSRLVVKVVDKDTQEVIRQMPTREALEIAKALDKLQSLLAKQSA
jgi:flagellar protein FlaG